MKLLTTLLLMALLSGCMGKQLEFTEQNHSTNYGGYLVALDSCKKNNFSELKYVDSGGKDSSVRIAGDCDDIQKPQHGGEYVAQVQTSYVQASGQVLAATIGAVATYEGNKNTNDTRIKLGQQQGEREAAENAVLLQAIGSRDTQTEAIAALTVSVTNQNSNIVDLVSILTEDESEQESQTDASDETESGGDDEQTQ